MPGNTAREVAHAREDARIAALIQQIFQEHRHVYGSPRIPGLAARVWGSLFAQAGRAFDAITGHQRSPEAVSEADYEEREKRAFCSQSAWESVHC